jgi:pimeloyl-ACP methyl ester carboxylesterase
VARDLDQLRQAVGDRKLTYAGFSYGTYLGATYANLFPSKVRAIWVDGVLDPVAWAGHGKAASRLPFSTRLDSGGSSAATMAAFLKACDAAGPRCAFSAGSPQKRYRMLLDRLRKAPIRDADGQIALTYAGVVAGLLDPLYFQDAWPSLGQQLQEFWELTAPGTTSARRGQLLQRVKTMDDQTGTDIDGFYSVACADTTNPRDPMAWARAADAADREAAPFGRLWTWDSARCATWGARDTDRYQGPFTAKTAAPVLVVGNKHDPATPYAGAVALSKLLPRSRLVTVDYAGHTSLGQSACVTKITTAYLVRGALPKRGVVCAADRKPFADVSPEQRTLITTLEQVVGR